eukprot:scaffold75535_cov35-Cyclotella_meneghiniana.AAC.3
MRAGAAGWMLLSAMTRKSRSIMQATREQKAFRQQQQLATKAKMPTGANVSEGGGRHRLVREIDTTIHCCARCSRGRSMSSRQHEKTIDPIFN